MLTFDISLFFSVARSPMLDNEIIICVGKNPCVVKLFDWLISYTGKAQYRYSYAHTELFFFQICHTWTCCRKDLNTDMVISHSARSVDLCHQGTVTPAATMVKSHNLKDSLDKQTDRQHDNWFRQPGFHMAQELILSTCGGRGWG